MKKRLTLALLILTSLFTLQFPAAAQSTAVRQKVVAERVAAAADSKTSSPVTAEKMEADMAEALTVIQENYVSGKQLDYNELFKSSIESMLHQLDPHSNYFDAKEYAEFRTEQNSRYFGIGATIGDLRDLGAGGSDSVKLATYIKATFEEAPANRAGLRYGDKIVDVNGTSMIGKPFTDVRNFLRGPRGTVAKITVERYDTKKLETVEIIRDAVAQPSIPEAYMLRPGVGYIAMTGGFNQTTYGEFVDGYKKLKEQGMQQLVLDLRSNGGGLVRQATQVANTFLNSEQIIFTQKGRIRGSYDVARSDNKDPEQMPMVVLVNRGTASASEILAGALQDHDRALIVGETTFGKGLVQNPFNLDYGSMVLLTIAKYETPSGRLIQRDYSNGDLYSYYNMGGTLHDEKTAGTTGAESKTDTGRPVYSGGGITPDEPIKAALLTNEQVQIRTKLQDPVFAFSLDLVYGKVPGFENYRVNNPLDYLGDVKATDFPVNDALYQAFKKYAVDKYKLVPAQVDKEHDYVGRALRTELATATYGMYTSYQVGNEFDNQLKKALESLPRAKDLAQKAADAWKSKPKSQTTALDGTQK
ncbi:MAG TPA: S41 family peptidase [Pyrinomonadaceae bacterium]|nr:S41 family peptidase [Pyrinomonadaceae bacterium]